MLLHLSGVSMLLGWPPCAVCLSQAIHLQLQKSTAQHSMVSCKVIRIRKADSHTGKQQIAADAWAKQTVPQRRGASLS